MKFRFDRKTQASIFPSGNKLLLPYDETELEIATPKFRDILFRLSPDYSTVNYKFVVDYQLSDQYRSQRQLSWGLGFLISGLAVAGTSFVFNLNPISIAFTKSYSGYVALKTATFDLFLAGGASTIGGLITTLNGLRL